MAEANEVEGRKEPMDVDVDIGPVHLKYCNVCPDVKATSFCENCHEYMCTNCTSYHRRITLTRNHTLMTGDQFPAVIPPRRQDKQTTPFEKCPDHPIEEIKFYCQEHGELCCVACNVLKHKQCSQSYIPDIAEDFKKGQEFNKLSTDIHDSEQLIVKGLVDIDNCLKAVNAMKADEIEKLRKYRTAIIEYLDRRERELQAEMQQLCETDTVLLRELQTSLEACQSNLKDISTKLKSHEQNSCELYIAAKRALAQMTRLESSLQKITEKIGYQRYSVMMDPRLQKIVEDHGGFADIERDIADLTVATLKRQPNVQLGNEKLKITDMTDVYGDKFLLTVEHERKLIFVDSKTDIVLFEIVLKDKPRFICMVDSQQAVTTLVNKKIQFIKVKDNTLEDEMLLDVDVRVMGIAAHKNSLIVSWSSGVKIISKDGAVIHKLDNTTAGRELFKKPRWIATTSDGSIYVTDWGMNNIIRLDFNLTLLQTFSGLIVNGPHGIIALNRDQLLVCNKRNNNILLIRPSTNSMTVLLDKQHGIQKPQSFCFCKKQKKVYVAPIGETTSVLVYKLT